jgi:hypothetical protein
VQNLLPAFIRDELVDDEQSLVRLHLESCETCKKQLAEEQELNSLLAEMPCTEPVAGFADRVIQNAVRQHHHHKAGFIKGFGAAMAAGLALWVVVGVLPVSKPEQKAAPQEISITLHEVKKVKLAFRTVNYLNDARITIHLPEHVELVGYTGKRMLSWKADLNQGENVLTLPIKAGSIASGNIVARIEHGKQVKTMVIGIGVRQPGMSRDKTVLNFV